MIDAALAAIVDWSGGEAAQRAPVDHPVSLVSASAVAEHGGEAALLALAAVRSLVFGWQYTQCFASRRIREGHRIPSWENAMAFSVCGESQNLARSFTLPPCWVIFSPKRPS
jgi:hypothetical protein